MEHPVQIVKALADGNRLRVVSALLQHNELCVCEIVEMLGLATGTVSRHMSILQQARLVQSRKEGRWVHYRLADEFPAPLRHWLLDSLADWPETAADQALLVKILAGGREKLCQQQKRRKKENVSTTKEERR